MSQFPSRVPQRQQLGMIKIRCELRPNSSPKALGPVPIETSVVVENG